MLARLWLQREWRHFLPALFAVSFSCLMLLVQAALVQGIFGSAAVYIDASDADIWVGRPGTQSVNYGQPIGMDVANILRSHPDAETVEPYLWVEGDWQVRRGGSAVSVYVSGIVPVCRGLMFSRLLTTAMRDRLREPGAVIVDLADLQTLDSQVGGRAWINGTPVHIVHAVPGLRALGGVNVVASMETARALQGDVSLGMQPTYVVMSLRKDADPKAVIADLSARAPSSNYEMWTAEDFAQRSQRYWMLDTGAGIAVTFMAAIVLLVGAVVTGQALVAAVNHVRTEFAVLIAMGVARRTLCRVVLILSLLIGVVGAIVGVMGAAAVLALASSRNVPVALTADITLWCMVAVLGLAIVSGVFAMRGVLQANPATLLR